MKIQWIKCGKTFDRDLFNEIGIIPEGKKTAYLLLKCQEIKGGKPESIEKVKLLTLEYTTGGQVNGRIDGTRYFEFFNTLYILDYVEVEVND